MPKLRSVPMVEILNLSKAALSDYLRYLRRRRPKRPEEAPEEYDAFIVSLKGYLSVDQADFVRKLMVNTYRFAQEDETLGAPGDDLRAVSSEELEDRILRLQDSA